MTKISPSFHLQVGECQKEGSSSGKQGPRGRDDLWILSQGGQRRLRRDGRGGREAEEREQECREGRGTKNSKIYETKREERRVRRENETSELGKCTRFLMETFMDFKIPNQNLVSCIFNPTAKRWCMYCIAYPSRKEPTENDWKWDVPDWLTLMSIIFKYTYQILELQPSFFSG